MRQLSRRATLMLGAGGAVLTALGWSGRAQADAKAAADKLSTSKVGAPLGGALSCCCDFKTARGEIGVSSFVEGPQPERLAIHTPERAEMAQVRA